MVYRIQIDQIGKTGISNGRLAQYETDTKSEAIALATYEVDIGKPVPQRIAAVFDPSGLLILTHIGRMRAMAGDERR